MILRARALVTMDGPPVEDGAVIIEGREIRAAGRWKDLAPHARETAVDLGERVLLPGLINAHCHLDYTMMRNAIRPPSSFTQWIKRINALKRTLDNDDYRQAIASGFSELIKWGTTTVLNLEAFPELLLELPPPPIRTWWFYELIDLRQRVPTDELVAGALLFFDERPEWLGGFGLNPHAPYTASLELYRLADHCARAAQMPLTTHLAESEEESEMFRRGSGPLFAFLESLGREMNDCGNGSALAQFARAGLMGEHWILAHLNSLDHEDVMWLARTRPHIVHCARSSRYFNHEPFQYRRLHELGLNISLGTDSLASNDSLNLFEEMRAVQHAEPSLSPRELLATVTVNPARALRRPEQLGRLVPAAFADLIALPFEGRLETVYETVVHHGDPVDWMMIDGQEI